MAAAPSRRPAAPRVSRRRPRTAPPGLEPREALNPTPDAPQGPRLLSPKIWVPPHPAAAPLGSRQDQESVPPRSVPGRRPALTRGPPSPAAASTADSPASPSAAPRPAAPRAAMTLSTPIGRPARALRIG